MQWDFIVQWGRPLDSTFQQQQRGVSDDCDDTNSVVVLSFCFRGDTLPHCSYNSECTHSVHVNAMDAGCIRKQRLEESEHNGWRGLFQKGRTPQTERQREGMILLIVSVPSKDFVRSWVVSRGETSCWCAHTRTPRLCAERECFGLRLLCVRTSRLPLAYVNTDIPHTQTDTCACSL